jgi:hypothetical protein
VASTKIQPFKFYNPGTSSIKSPVVLAARKNVLATNRLGKTVEGIGSLVSDIETINIKMIKNEKLRERAERQRAQRQRDQAAEDAAERSAIKKAGQGSLGSKLKRQTKKGLKGGFSWLEKFLGPVGNFLLQLGAFFVTTEVMKWISDESNREKLATFLDKALFVFDKLFSWASTLTNKVLDGWSALFAEDGDFGSRLKGLGDMMLGIIGLKYLMNPFSLITDILGLLDMADSIPDPPDGNRKKPNTGPDGKPRTKPKGNRFTRFLNNQVENLKKPLRSALGVRTLNPFGDNRNNYSRYVDELTGNKPGPLANLVDNSATQIKRFQNFGTGLIDSMSTEADKVLKSESTKKLFKNLDPKNLWNATVDKSLQIADSLGFDEARRQSVVETGQKLLDDAVEGGTALMDKFKKQGESITKGVFGFLDTSWKNLTFQEGTAFRAGAEITGRNITFQEGSTFRKAADSAIKFASEKATAIRNGISSQFAKFGNMVNELGAAGKNFIMEKLVGPLLDNLKKPIKFVMGLGAKFGDSLTKIPYVGKLVEALKKNGIKGLGDFGSAAMEKIGPNAWPIIGGIFGLVSAYDRLTSNDPTGSVFDFASALFDLSSAPFIIPPAGFVPGSGISLGIDLFMLARDLAGMMFPEFDPREPEDALIAKFGMSGLQNGLRSIGEKLPSFGEIGAIFGQAKEQDKGEGKSVGGTVQEPQEYFLGGIVKGISRAVSGVVKGVSKAVSSVGNFVGGIVNNPIVKTAAMFIPGAAPIVGGISAISSLASGNPMGAVMAGLNHFAPGMMAGIDNVLGKVTGFLDSPIGQIGQNLMTGNILGAADIGLGMIGGPIGSLGQKILGGDFGGAITSGLGMISPDLGSLAESVLKGGFNPASMIAGAADHFGLGGILDAVTGISSGDPSKAIEMIGSELGIDKKVLGVVDNVATKALSSDGISAKYAMQQALEFVPIPLIIEKIEPILQAVPININRTKVVQAVKTTLSEI